VSNLSDFYEAHYNAQDAHTYAAKRQRQRQERENELQRQAAPTVAAAALAVETFGEDELERFAAEQAWNERNRQDALTTSQEGVARLHSVRRTGEVPCPGALHPFREVVRPANGYRDPEADFRLTIEIEVDCSCCNGTGYYHSRYSYCGPCRLCNATGVVTVRGYQIDTPGHRRCCG